MNKFSTNFENIIFHVPNLFPVIEKAEKWNKENFVFFGDVLINSADQLAKEKNRPLLENLLKQKFYKSKGDIKLLEDEIEKITQIVHSKSSYVATDFMALPLNKFLNQKQIRNIAINEISYPSDLSASNIFQNKIREIKRIGYQFSDLNGIVALGNLHDDVYKDGIIFSKDDLGKTASNFFKNSNIKPPKVILIEKSLEKIKGFCEEMLTIGIEPKAFCLIQEEDEELDPTLQNHQIEYLIDTGTWISDELIKSIYSKNFPHILKSSDIKKSTWIL